MNGLDIIIISLISISVAFGLYRGLVREIFSFLALILGFLAAVWYYKIPAQFLLQWFSNPSLANVIGFIAIFIGVALIIGLIGTLIRRFMKHAHLDLEDRLLGGIFGFIKGLFVSTVLVIILVAFMPPEHPFVAQSKMLPYFVRLATVVKEVFPAELKDTVNEKKKELLQFWKEQKQTTSSPNITTRPVLPHIQPIRFS